MPDEYYKFITKVNMKKISNGKEFTVPDIPFKYYGFEAVYENKHINTRSPNLELEGKEIIAMLIIDKNSESEAKLLSGFIGDEAETVLSNPDYYNAYTITVKDNKRNFNEETQEVIEYTGDDKDDAVLFCSMNIWFCQQNFFWIFDTF